MAFFTNHGSRIALISSPVYPNYGKRIQFVEGSGSMEIDY